MKHSPLKRKTPLRPERETKHYVREREERFPGVYIDAIHKKPRGSYGPAELAAAPKFDYVRSASLMQAYRKIACQGCGRNDGTVCGAHSNWSVHGKGRSVKASDIYCASLCSVCHQSLDQGSAWTETERKEFWWTAHRLTVIRLVERELWPLGVRTPDVSRSPFEK